MARHGLPARETVRTSEPIVVKHGDNLLDVGGGRRVPKVGCLAASHRRPKTA
jgi:hypothetical protein